MTQSPRVHPDTDEAKGPAARTPQSQSSGGMANSSKAKVPQVQSDTVEGARSTAKNRQVQSDNGKVTPPAANDKQAVALTVAIEGTHPLAHTNGYARRPYPKAEVFHLVPTEFYRYASSDSEADCSPSGNKLRATDDDLVWCAEVEQQMRTDEASIEPAICNEIASELVGRFRRIRVKRPPEPHEEGERPRKARRPG